MKKCLMLMSSLCIFTTSYTSAPKVALAARRCFSRMTASLSPEIAQLRETIRQHKAAQEELVRNYKKALADHYDVMRDIINNQNDNQNEAEEYFEKGDDFLTVKSLLKERLTANQVLLSITRKEFYKPYTKSHRDLLHLEIKLINALRESDATPCEQKS